jgi:PhnB protein
MMHISPHLTFDGQCRAAFQLYHRILGGTIATMLTYGESPMASQIDSRWHERIVHATLRLGDVELTGTDLLPHDYRRPEGFFVTLTLESATQAEDIFNALAEDGEGIEYVHFARHFGRLALASWWIDSACRGNSTVRKAKVDSSSVGGLDNGRS